MHKKEDIQQHIRDLEDQLEESAYVKADGTDVQRAWYYLKTFPYLSVYLALEKTRPLFEEFTQSYPCPPSEEPYGYFVEQYQRFREKAAEYDQLQDKISVRESELSQKKDELEKLTDQVGRLNSEISLLREEYDEYPERGTIDREHPKIRELRGVGGKMTFLNTQIHRGETVLEKEKQELSRCLSGRNLFNKYQPLYDCLHDHFRLLDSLVGPEQEDKIYCAHSFWRYSYFLKGEEVRVYRVYHRLIKETQEALKSHLERAKQALEMLEKKEEGVDEPTTPSTLCDDEHYSVLFDDAETSFERGTPNTSPVGTPDASPVKLRFFNSRTSSHSLVTQPTLAH